MTKNCNLCKDSFECNETETLICEHEFCLECLRQVWSKNCKSILKCPISNCSAEITLNIVQQILDEKDIEIYEQTIVKNLKNVYQCILSECSHYNKYSNTQYQCQFCFLHNCVSCNAAHYPKSCTEYKLLDVSQRKLFSDKLLTTARQFCAANHAENHRKSIIQANSNSIIPNPNIFQCPLCVQLIRKKAGVLLSKCFHNFCKSCIKSHIIRTDKFPICCPESPCSLELTDTECRGLLDKDELEHYNNKCYRIVLSKIDGGKICRYPDCRHVVKVEGDGEYWDCPKCQSRNCIKCSAIHPNLTCNEYLMANLDPEIEERIKRKELMRCPCCHVFIEKSRGCNWIKCMNCKTELCWILQTYRWGPNGCKCGIDGKLCHPECKGCQPEIDSSLEEELSADSISILQKELKISFDSNLVDRLVLPEKRIQGKTKSTCCMM